ncbi:hypothetical protein [Flavobacterium restrictum]|uniref:Collagen-like protein n=1 Tax=Flavobacterium restrictum TaxID=2594428 RepID=A0A553EAQ1_9FLAO|nr:hypothetical protein [Flavobacterium restrictum]TRX42110.1 hypothetical protein FNW21_02235 [Flavobacterium restrictum]
MKTIITLFAIVGMIAFTSCTGPEGAPGVPGQDGLLGSVYENKSSSYYNFTSSNNYKVRFNFPKEIYDSDVVLVYRLAGVDNNGKAIWKFLPETYYQNNDARDFSFNFNFTYSYVDIYMSGTNLITVSNDYRLNQIFRIVVVPADFASTVNKNNFTAVMTALKINESQVQKVNF